MGKGSRMASLGYPFLGGSFIGGSTVLALHLIEDCYFVGLPQHEKNKLENIHFLTCSNMVNALELVEPIVDSLQKLAHGIEMFDAWLKRPTLVIAPVMLIIADNPMGSELCNHQLEDSVECAL